MPTDITAKLDQLQAIKPQAWMVFCPKGHEFDYMVFPDKDGAETHAYFLNDDCPEGESPYEAIPLYAVGAAMPRLIAAVRVLAEGLDNLGSHHAARNNAVGRPIENSRTIRFVNEALASAFAELEKINAERTTNK